MRDAAARSLALEVLPGTFSVCRLAPDAPAPSWATQRSSKSFVSVTRTSNELSIVCDSRDVPPDFEGKREDGFRALCVVGPLDFSLVGVLSAILSPLAGSKISTLAMATFETDYILVREQDLARAIVARHDAGHRVGL